MEEEWPADFQPRPVSGGQGAEARVWWGAGGAADFEAFVFTSWLQAALWEVVCFGQGLTGSGREGARPFLVARPWADRGPDMVCSASASPVEGVKSLEAGESRTALQRVGMEKKVSLYSLLWPEGVQI